MPLSNADMLLVLIELSLLVGGTILLARAWLVPEQREAIFNQSRLVHWPITGTEVALLVVSIFVCGLIGHLLLTQFLPAEGRVDREAWTLVFSSVGFQGIGLLGWPLFAAMRRSMHGGYGGTPPAVTNARPLATGQVIRHALATLLMAFPVVALASWGSTFVLRSVGYKVSPQEAIGIFQHVQERVALIALIAVVCVIAPLNEELLFRGAIFRFSRQRFGRIFALVASSALFGIVHFNLVGFLPLACLGCALALAYEKSGDIRVPILAHALFNFGNIMFLLARGADA